MIDTAKQYKKAVVIGGGLLGLEAANGLKIRGMDVTVVHLSSTLMNQQLDHTSAELMREELEASGLNFLMEHQTEALIGDQRVEKIRFKNGTEIDTDLVVMAVGVRPNIELAKSSGLQCERGILVDDTLQTYSPNIYAVGECVQHRNQTFGLVAPLYEQAKVCANHLAEMGIAHYLTAPTATKLKVTGINLFSAGDFIGDEDSESLIYADPARYVYKKTST
jgi:nitrite reductase (NADH) large subunit